MTPSTPVIAVKNLVTRRGTITLHDQLNFTVAAGNIVALVGNSGCGKTSLMRAILMLNPPVSGTIQCFGETLTPQTVHRVQQRWGVLFQNGALFSDLTVLENIQFPLQTYSQLNKATCSELATLKLALAGFPLHAIHYYPAELSGGMRKRAALARAIALDPDLLFLDEPTAGLDPQGASKLDELVIQLRDTLGLTVVIITHDLDTLRHGVDEIAFIGEKRILAQDSLHKLMEHPHPLIHDYFANQRAQLRSNP